MIQPGLKVDKYGPDPQRTLTFGDHVEELRKRIITCVLAVIVCSVVCFSYVDSILPMLIRPVGRLVFTSPSEGFSVYFMISLCGGIILAMPVLLFQLWQFVASGLTTVERRFAFVFIPLVFLFFIAGCLFGFMAILPMMLKFFLSFSGPYLVAMITASEYFSFILTLVLSCGLVFEYPLVIVLLTRVGIATPAFLIEMRRYALVAIFILSAFLTPSPDFISQIVMAIPLIALYEISIGLSILVHRLKLKEAPTQKDP